VSAVLEQATLTLRPMAEEDLEQVAEIEERAHVSPWSFGILQDCLRAGYACWVMEAGEQIAAFGILGVGAGESHILNLCVDPDWQRQGLGRRLLRFLLDLAREHHATEAFLEVRPSNRAALALYHSEGFNEVGCRHNYYPGPDGPEDALILARSLETGT